MSLKNLYQEVIIDHNKNPSNYGKLSCATNIAKGNNPLCGDQLTIYLVLEDNIIREAKFLGEGCAISIASASLLTEEVIGRDVKQARQIFEDVHRMLTENKTTETLGKLKVLEGAAEFPTRVKCATLAWHTLVAALDNSEIKVTTE